ncbi:MAG: helix-turn-helix domain-containing protein [Ardenticatenales bacterium]
MRVYSMDDNRQTTGAVIMAGDSLTGGPDDLLSTAEAAEVMGVSDAHVRRVIGDGELKARRIGGRSWVIRRADAEAWKAVERRTGPKGGTLGLDEGALRQAIAMPELSPARGIPTALLQKALAILRAGDYEGVSIARDGYEITFRGGAAHFRRIADSSTSRFRRPIEF